MGPTRMGKRVGTVRNMMDVHLSHPDVRFVVIAPHEQDIGRDTIHALDGKDCVRVKLGEPRVLRLKLLPRSKAATPYLRAIENDEQKRRFADLLLSRRGQFALYERPLIEEGLMAALSLWLYQEYDRPFSWLRHALDFEHPKYLRMFAECTDAEAKWKHEQYRQMPKLERLRATTPAARCLGGIDSPAFLAVCDGDVTVGDLLDDGKHIVFEGTRGVSENSQRLLFLTGAQGVYSYFRSGGTRRVVMVVDEANSWNLVDGYSCRAMAEMQKWGFSQWILCQTLDFGDPAVTESVLTNCGRVEMYRTTSPSMIELSSILFGIPSLDPHLVHHSDARERQLIEGYEAVETHSSSDSRSTDNSEHSGGSVSEEKQTTNWGNGNRAASGQSWTTGQQWLPQHRSVWDETKHYYALNDLLLLAKKVGMELGVGERLVKDGSKVWRERVEMAKANYSWLPKEKVVERILEQMHALPLYKDAAQALETERDEDAAELLTSRIAMKKRSNGSISTSAPS